MARGRPSKKGLITEAALRLFQVAGYQGTSIDQVVLEAGVSKPTIYSHFPSKLVLWQEVLIQINAQSEQAMSKLSEKLERKSTAFVEGWLAIWNLWLSGAERLAVYRIHWGENHKLTQEEQRLFLAFEAILMDELQAWMAHHQIDESLFVVLQGLTREALLVTKLTSGAPDIPNLPALLQRLTCCSD